MLNVDGRQGNEQPSVHCVDSFVSSDIPAGQFVVHMPIVEVVVNECHTTYALLDSASTSSFITEDLAGKLCLEREHVTCNMNTLSQSN